MGKIHVSHAGEGSIHSLVVGVAGAAGQARILLLEGPVQGGGILPLGGDIHVAAYAEVGHGGGGPKSRMTARAAVAQVGMGRDPAENGTGLRVERPGAEQRPAARHHQPGDNQAGQKSSQDAKSCQTAKAILHSVSPGAAGGHDPMPRLQGIISFD